MSTKCAVDHLVLAARTLDEGRRYVEDVLGVATEAGGKHAEMGTHNRLVCMDGAYLEVIACDPAAAPPQRPRWFGLDSPGMQRRLAVGPALVTWAVRVPDLGARRLARGFGSVRAMRRGAFAWRLTAREDGQMPFDGMCPFLIEWTGGVHPTDVLRNCGLHLASLHADHERAPELRTILGALDCEATIELARGPAALRASISTRRGMVELVSRCE